MMIEKLLDSEKKEIVLKLSHANRYSYKTIGDFVGLPWQTVRSQILDNERAIVSNRLQRIMKNGK